MIVWRTCHVWENKPPTEMIVKDSQSAEVCEIDNWVKVAAKRIAVQSRCDQTTRESWDGANVAIVADIKHSQLSERWNGHGKHSTQTTVWSRSVGAHVHIHKSFALEWLKQSPKRTTPAGLTSFLLSLARVPWTGCLALSDISDLQVLPSNSESCHWKRCSAMTCKLRLLILYRAQSETRDSNMSDDWQIETQMWMASFKQLNERDLQQGQAN